MSWRERIWPGWFGRNVAVATGARVAMSAARALAGVMVPVYLALAGYSAFRLGLLFVVVGVASAGLSTAVGFLSDRLGRKAFLIGVPLLASGAGVAYALSLDPVVVFVAGALGSFGRGGGAGGGTVGPYAPAEQALVAESVPPANRNAAFGRLAFGSSLGAVAGSLLAAGLVSDHPARAHLLAAYRPGFMALAACAFVAGAAGLLLHETGPHRQTEEPPARPREQGQVGRGRGQGQVGRGRGRILPRASAPLLYRLWAANALNGTAVGMFGPFVSYWFYRRYGVGAATIGELYAVINAATTVSNLSAAGFGRRWGLVRSATWFRVAQAVLLVPMVLAPAFLVAGGIYLVRMAAQRVAMPLRQSYVMAMADPAERARVAALSRLSSQVTAAGSPALAGELFDHVSLAAPFLIGGLLQLANAAVFFLFFRRRPPEEEVAAAALPEAEPSVLGVPGEPGGPGGPGEPAQPSEPGVPGG
ncbi:MAG: MFS transporter [Acidimicrobiales bacterium]